MKKAFSTLFAITMICAPFSAYADEGATLTLVPNESSQVVVQVSSVSSENLASIEAIPGVVITDILSGNTLIVEASSSAAHAADVLDDLPFVSYAEPSYERSALTISSNDTLKDRLWGLDNTGQVVASTTGTAGDDIDAVRAWSLSYGTSSIVAVIDSGVLYTHPDLSANMWDGASCVDENGSALGNCIHGYDFADNDKDPAPVVGSTTYQHGTHVAGTIAAARDNSIGIIGVAPSAKIMALRFNFDTASEVRAIDFARRNGVKIINASYGGTQYSQAEYDAIQRFTSSGGLFIAAAGNSTSNSDTVPTYPAAYDLPGIVSVAATDQDDALASFSNYGTTTVDLGAPGVNIASTYFTGTSTVTYAYADGTSMAAPHVAGTAALIESLYPLLAAQDVKTALLHGDTDVALTDKSVSGKRLNAYTALLVAGGADFDPPVITLNGASSLSLTVGDTYTELGATALDTRDGTTTVTVGGDVVNTAIAGTYHVTYDSVDAALNHAAQLIRTVTVTAPVVSSGGGGGGGSGSSGGGGGGGSKKTVKKKVTSTPTKVSVPRPALATSTNPTPAPSTPSAPITNIHVFTQQLGLGSTSMDVTALQQLLTKLNIYTGPITGYYGPLTQAAVRAYQARHSIVQLGTVGPLTRAALSTGS